MTHAVIGLGSNIDPQLYIEKARACLKESFDVIKESRFVQTKAVNMPGQADFINGAVLIRTDLSCEALEKTLKNIEIRLNRSPAHKKYAPRTIDLDIVIYDNRITDEDVHTRDFLKASVLELLPDLEGLA